MILAGPPGGTCSHPGGGKQAKAGHNRSAISLLKELVVIWYMYFGTNGYLYGKLFQLCLVERNMNQ